MQLGFGVGDFPLFVEAAIDGALDEFDGGLQPGYRLLDRRRHASCLLRDRRTSLKGLRGRLLLQFPVPRIEGYAKHYRQEIRQYRKKASMPDDPGEMPGGAD